MRNAFLAVVLLNLGVAAWTHWFTVQPRSTRSFDSGAPRIALANEAAAEPDTVVTNDPVSLLTTTPQQCVSIGPFPNRVVVAEVLRALGDAGFGATQRIAQGDVWLGYWVYIDAIPTQAEATSMVEILAANGITDAYVIADGNRGSLVSLGVFSVRGRAEQRLNQARNLGLNAVVTDRSQPGDVYWLDVTANDAGPIIPTTLLRTIGQRSEQVTQCVER